MTEIKPILTAALVLLLVLIAALWRQPQLVDIVSTATIR